MAIIIIIALYGLENWREREVIKGQSQCSHQVCLIPKPGVLVAVLCGLHLQKIVGNTAFLGMEYVRGYGVGDYLGKDL